jgi:hypothetical protein
LGIRGCSVEHAEVVDQPHASRLGPSRSTLRSSDGPAARTQLVAGLKAKLGSTVSDVADKIGDVEANDFDRVRDNLKRDGLTEEREEGKRYLVEAKATGRQYQGARRSNPVGTSALP